MDKDKITNSHDSITQQNKLFYAKQKLKYKPLFSDIRYSRQELPDLVSKYEGYMQIYNKRRGTQTEPS